MLQPATRRRVVDPELVRDIETLLLHNCPLEDGTGPGMDMMWSLFEGAPSSIRSGCSCSMEREDRNAKRELKTSVRSDKYFDGAESSGQDDSQQPSLPPEPVVPPPRVDSRRLGALLSVAFADTGESGDTGLNCCSVVEPDDYGRDLASHGPPSPSNVKIPGSESRCRSESRFMVTWGPTTKNDSRDFLSEHPLPGVTQQQRKSSPTGESRCLTGVSDPGASNPIPTNHGSAHASTHSLPALRRPWSDWRGRSRTNPLSPRQRQKLGLGPEEVLLM